MHRPGPFHREQLSGQRRLRTAQRHRGFGDLDGCGAEHLIALVRHVAQFIHAGIRGGPQVTLGPVLHADVVAVLPRLGTGGHDGDVIPDVQGLVPAHPHERPCGGRLGAGDDHFGAFRLRFRPGLRFGYRSGHDAERLPQFLGIAGRNVLPAGLLRQAGQRTRIRIAKTEPNHMRREPDAPLLKRFRQRARVAVAAFQPVGDKHHGGRRIGIGQLCRGLFHRTGQRRLPRWGDPADPVENVGAGAVTRGDDGFDIRAIPAPPVTIGHQPDPAALGPVSQQVVHHALGDLDLGGALDLAPHRVRPVENDHDVLILRDGRGGTRHPPGKRECSSAQGILFHVLFLPGLVLALSGRGMSVTVMPDDHHAGGR